MTKRNIHNLPKTYINYTILMELHITHVRGFFQPISINFYIETGPKSKHLMPFMYMYNNYL